MSAVRTTLDLIQNPAMREQVERKLAELRLAAAKKRRAKHPPRPYAPGKKIPVTPRAVSMFRLQLLADGLFGWEEEVKFHPERGWRMDFGHRKELLAVEIEGLTFDGGRHQRFKGFNEDCRKYLAAMQLGWRVIRVTPLMVRTGEAIAGVKRLLAIKT